MTKVMIYVSGSRVGKTNIGKIICDRLGYDFEYNEYRTKTVRHDQEMSMEVGLKADFLTDTLEEKNDTVEMVLQSLVETKAKLIYLYRDDLLAQSLSTLFARHMTASKEERKTEAAWDSFTEKAKLAEEIDPFHLDWVKVIRLVEAYARRLLYAHEMLTSTPGLDYKCVSYESVYEDEDYRSNVTEMFKFVSPEFDDETIEGVLPSFRLVDRKARDDFYRTKILNLDEIESQYARFGGRAFKAWKALGK